MTDIPYMEKTTIAERIRLRLESLGKNPSAVALEAGLSRSSVLDILKGKAANPRLDTLQKLTGPLQCSLQYLTGAVDRPGEPDALSPAEYALYDGTIERDALELAVGVYRDRGAQLRKPVPLTMVYRDPDHPEQSVSLAVMGDESLRAIGILRGDLITYFFAGFDDIDIPLVHGSIVLTRRVIGDGPAEYSARQVEISGGKVSLLLRPAADPGAVIEIRSHAGSDDSKYLRNAYLTNPEAGIFIEGVAVRVTRVLPTAL